MFLLIVRASQRSAIKTENSLCAGKIQKVLIRELRTLRFYF